MSVTIKIGDIARTMDNVKTLDGRTVQLLAQFAFDESQRGAGRHSKTGALFQSLYNRNTGNGRAVGHDTGRAPHAEFVLLGARPHDIFPSKKKVLRWPKKGFTGPLLPGGSGGKGRSGWMFAKVIHHPGNRADPYLFQAGDAALRNFSAFVDKAFKEIT